MKITLKNISQIFFSTGAARYDSVLPVYLKDSIIVLIFYSCVDSVKLFFFFSFSFSKFFFFLWQYSFERIRQLYKTSKQHANNALVGIVATKIDLPDKKKEISSKYAYKFCEENDIFFWELDNTQQNEVDNIINDLVCWIKIYTKFKAFNPQKQDTTNCTIN
jgi:hypothetical protein